MIPVMGPGRRHRGKKNDGKRCSDRCVHRILCRHPLHREKHGKEGGNNHPAPDSEKPREKARSNTEGYERQKNEERHAVLTQRKIRPAIQK